MFTTNSEEMVNNISSMYASLTGENNESALQEIKRMASEEASHDHWLETNKLSYEGRLFLCAGEESFRMIIDPCGERRGVTAVFAKI